MRFVAKIRNYSHGVRDEEFEFVAAPGGRMEKRITQRGLEAQFSPRGLTAYEIEQGKTQLQHKGLPEDKDTRIEVQPTSRLSFFDSEVAQRENRWTDEERDIVEQALLNSTAHGQEFIYVPTPARPEPWPGYDKLSVDQILEAINLGVVDVDYNEVVAYERENAARDELITELTADPELEQETIVQL